MSKLEKSAKTAQETASLLSSVAQEHKAKGNTAAFKANKEDASSWQKLADHLKGGKFKAAVDHYDAMPQTVKDHGMDLDDGALHAHLSSALKEMSEIVTILEGLGLSEETGTKLFAMLEASQEAAYQEGFDAAKATETNSLEEAKKLEEQNKEFRAQIKEAAEAYIAERQELIKEAAEAYVEHRQEIFKEAAEAYVEKAVSEFVEAKEAEFVNLDLFNRMQTAFGMIKESFELNGFSIVENKKEEALKEAIAEVTSQYDEVYSLLKESQDSNETLQQEITVEKAFAKLTESQREKANRLLENLSFNSFEDFEKGLAVITESVSKKVEKAEEVEKLEEDVNTNKKNNPLGMDFRGLL